MPTPSGKISISNVENTLNEGLSSNYPGGTSRLTFNDILVRTLASKPSGRISMNDMRNKAGPLPYGTIIGTPTCSGSTLVQTLADGRYGTFTNNVFNSPACAIIASLTISSNTTNYTLNTGKVSGYIAGKTRVTLTINSGVYVYSTSTFTSALTVTGFAAGDVINIINNGFIVGMGGKGGAGGQPSSGGGSGGGGNGSPGGSALRTTFTMSLTNNGTIGGGGGGGGGGNGWSGGYNYSGGATGGGGRVLGPSGDPYIGEFGPQASGFGASGTLTAPGNGAPRVFPAGASGAGGNLGQSGGGGEGLTDGAGFYHPPSFGGAAGPAIVGNNLITYSVRGNILGAYT